MKIVGGRFRSRRLNTPKGQTTRPTSARLRETVFNICQGCLEGAAVLDVFAGSGGMGFEALSRGAERVTFIENSRPAIQCIRENADLLDTTSQIAIVPKKALQALEELAKKGKQFNLIYVDPPYHTKIQVGDRKLTYADAVLELIDQSNLLHSEGILFIEKAEEHPQQAITGSLEEVSRRRVGPAELIHYSRKESTR